MPSNTITASQPLAADAMTTAFAATANVPPIVLVHLAAALAALLLGAWMFVGRKGSTAHRALGWTWVALMTVAAGSSFFIHGGRLPALGGFSPIHALTLLVVVTLPQAVRHARRGDVRAHRSAMTWLYTGACVVAGAFTLLPGRLLGGWLWRDWLGFVA